MTFPPASSYKPLTVGHAEAVRDSKNKPRSRVGPVAHVGPSRSEEGAVEATAVLGVGEDESDDSEGYVHTTHTPFSSGHLEWRCLVDGPSGSIAVTTLIDNGSHSVLIDDALVERLGLRRRPLPNPQRARLAMGDGEVTFSEWVKLRTVSEDQQWTARVVRAIVAPKLAYPVILGGPFLKSNKIVIDHELGEVTAKDAQFRLLPRAPVAANPGYANDLGQALGVRDQVKVDGRPALMAELQERRRRGGLWRTEAPLRESRIGISRRPWTIASRS
jgi:hypothetical protein